MNEFISNSGTLINPDSVYDQERFINIFQIILQKKTQKELSEQTGLNNATISRMLNGARSGIKNGEYLFKNKKGGAFNGQTFSNQMIRECKRCV